LPPSSRIGASRSLANIAQGETEANNARIYGGLHYRSSNVASDNEGRTITDFVLDNVATPKHRERDWMTRRRRARPWRGDCHGDGASEAATTEQ